jgi:hypothetical protein
VMGESYRDSLPRIFLVESEFAAALRDAEIGYLRQLLADIESGALTGVEIWRQLHELRAQDLTPAEIDAALAKEFPIFGSLPGPADTGEVPPEAP